MIDEKNEQLKILQRIEMKLDVLLDNLFYQEDEDLIETTLDGEKVGSERDESDEL